MTLKKKSLILSFELKALHAPALSHAPAQTSWWMVCLYLLALRARDPHFKREKPSGFGCNNVRKHGQFFGCRFWLKKQLYPSVSIENDFLTWRQSQRSGWAWLILSVHADIRFPSRQSLANWKMELNHQSSSHNQQKKNKTSQRKATSL